MRYVELPAALLTKEEVQEWYLHAEETAGWARSGALLPHAFHRPAFIDAHVNMDHSTLKNKK